MMRQRVMSETKYDLTEAHLMLGREAARYGDWTGERHAAAAVLMRELATLDEAKLKSAAVTAQIGAHLIEPHVLRFEFAGGHRVLVVYEEGMFVARDPAGKRPSVDIDLHFNAYTNLFESHEADPAHPGLRRSAATLIVKKAFQHLHET